MRPPPRSELPNIAREPFTLNDFGSSPVGLALSVLAGAAARARSRAGTLTRSRFTAAHKSQGDDDPIVIELGETRLPEFLGWLGRAALVIGRILMMLSYFDARRVWRTGEGFMRARRMGLARCS